MNMTGSGNVAGGVERGVGKRVRACRRAGPWGGRGRGVAAIAVAGLAAAGSWMGGCSESAPVAVAEQHRVKVQVQMPERMAFERAISVQGTVEAKSVAAVSPRLEGVLDTIFVDEGDRVEAGKTKLFQTDAVKLTKTVEVRRHAVDVAESSLREKRASLEKNQVDLEDAEREFNRQRRLYERGASSGEELEDAETAYRANAAMLKHGQALVDLAGAQVRQARSALAIAQKDLDDALVTAPISGFVTERLQEPGEMGKPGQTVLRIEDPTLVEVSVYLPAEAYKEVAVGTTTMRVVVSGVDLGEQVVAYKSPSINARLRTFEARCQMQDPPAAVAPGAMAEVRVILDRREGLAVPRDAIQDRSGGKVLFVADGERARQVSVAVGLEQDGLVEVISDALSTADEVIVVGSYFLDPDALIQVATEAR
jgi:RND family efflux transporter MFP subunit